MIRQESPRKSFDAKPEKDGQTTQTNEEGRSTNGNKGKSESSKGETKKSVSIENLREGQGIVLEDKKMATYKDHKGELRTYSAICTHLGCTVTWNNFEKSFDCPCHGSRFSAISGNVINGPANFELKILK
jgi:Rieske Fe-S protein